MTLKWAENPVRIVSGIYQQPELTCAIKVDVQSGDVVLLGHEEKAFFRASAISEDCCLLGLATTDTDQIYVYDIDSGETVATLRFHGRMSIERMGFDSRARYLVFSEGEGPLVVAKRRAHPFV